MYIDEYLISLRLSEDLWHEFELLIAFDAIERDHGVVVCYHSVSLEGILYDVEICTHSRAICKRLLKLRD